MIQNLQTVMLVFQPTTWSWLMMPSSLAGWLRAGKLKEKQQAKEKFNEGEEPTSYDASWTDLHQPVFQMAGATTY